MLVKKKRLPFSSMAVGILKGTLTLTLFNFCDLEIMMKTFGGS